MEKTQIVPKIYGYVVCLVAVIVALISIGNIINASFDRSNPTHARSYQNSSYNVSSFVAYKADYQTSITSDKAATQTVLTDDQLKADYDAARANRVDTVNFDTTKTITVYVIMLVVAMALFVSHWIWLRKFEK